jgi:hypothetical protein
LKLYNINTEKILEQKDINENPLFFSFVSNNIKYNEKIHVKLFTSNSMLLTDSNGTTLLSYIYMNDDILLPKYKNKKVNNKTIPNTIYQTYSNKDKVPSIVFENKTHMIYDKIQPAKQIIKYIDNIIKLN